MILTDEEALKLKKRLIAQLEPICDAEPAVLADYVIALLRHDKEDEELLQLCASQLEDFLRDNTMEFLKDLFNFLKQGKYQDKYQEKYSDEKRKKKRDTRPYKRGICRDYSEKGYCVRENCRYEHVEKRDHSQRKMDEDGYDPEDPGLVVDKSTVQGQSRINRKASGPYKLKKDTLVIEKIPADCCSVEKINEYFGKFGNIINAAVDKNQLKAQVQYERFREAQAAYSCPDSIFGNRFVKAYFLREYEENGVRSTNGIDSQNSSPSQISQTAPMAVDNVKPPQLVFYEKGKKLIELQKNQEAIISQQIEASKMLMTQLASPNISANEKKVLLEQLKVLQGSTQSLVEKAAEHTKMLKIQSSPSQENLEKQRLDRELDVLNQMAVVSEEVADSPVDTELKTKLEALKAEASALGIPGYASRGRGRGGKFRRGVGSLRLDNRSRKLLVTGNSEKFLSALNEHCQSLSGIESIIPQSDKSAIISFVSRIEAEAAVVKPIKIEGLEGIQVQWVAGDPETASNSAITASATNQIEKWEEEEEDRDVSWKRR